MKRSVSVLCSDMLLLVSTTGTHSPPNNLSWHWTCITYYTRCIVCVVFMSIISPLLYCQVLKWQYHSSPALRLSALFPALTYSINVGPESKVIQDYRHGIDRDGNRVQISTISLFHCRQPFHILELVYILKWGVLETA